MDTLIWFAVLVGIVGILIEAGGALMLPLQALGAWVAAHKNKEGK